MFEKEAEETVDKSTWLFPQSKELAKDFWQKGAEFGYNKANEWHYCKNELPDHNGQFYVALKGQTETFICTYDYDEEDDSKMIWLDDDYNICDEVYAWREKLKTPKEIE